MLFLIFTVLLSAHNIQHDDDDDNVVDNKASERKSNRNQLRLSCWWCIASRNLYKVVAYKFLFVACRQYRDVSDYVIIIDLTPHKSLCSPSQLNKLAYTMMIKLRWYRWKMYIMRLIYGTSWDNYFLFQYFSLSPTKTKNFFFFVTKSKIGKFINSEIFESSFFLRWYFKVN